MLGVLGLVPKFPSSGNIAVYSSVVFIRISDAQLHHIGI